MIDDVILLPDIVRTSGREWGISILPKKEIPILQYQWKAKIISFSWNFQTNFLIPRFREKWSKARKLEEAKRSKEEVKERERAERKRSKEVDKMMLFEEDRVVSDDADS